MANADALPQLPYISWGPAPRKAQDRRKSEHGVKDHQKLESTSHVNQQDSVWPSSKQDTPLIVHEALTLDQYYYKSIKDTYTRDRDQALWRLFDDYQYEKTPKSTRFTGGANMPQDHKSPENKTQDYKILKVNQLWLWILDDGDISVSVLAGKPR